MNRRPRSNPPFPPAGLVAFALVALAGGAGGCQDDFAPYTRLAEMRVLAIRAEPTASPGFNETVTLRPAIYLLPGQTIATYQWEWCPFPGPSTAGYPCAISHPDLVALVNEQGGPGDMIPDYNLVSVGDTASFTNVFPPELLAAVCAGMSGTPFAPDCDDGFPIQIKLRVAGPAGDPLYDEIEAVWTLRLPIDSAVPLNQNPVLEMPAQMVAVVGGQDRSIDELMSPTVTLPRDMETVVRLDGLTEAASESYYAVDDEGQSFLDHERLTLSWFVESGDIDEARTAFIFDVEPIEDTRRNSWTPALREDYDRNDARIFVIIRDNRGGVTWAEGRVLLEDAP